MMFVIHLQRIRSASLWIALVAGCGLLLAAAQNQPDDAQVVKDFAARIDQYMSLEKQQAALLKPTDSPDKLAAQRNQMSVKMRAARSNAKQGDIFTPEIAAYFKRQIAATLAGADGAKIRASLRHAEPLRPIRLRVNARYPQKVPLQSTPPTLLLNLPRLPKELQYRIVGHDLVLYDAPANLIADYISNAVPAS